MKKSTVFTQVFLAVVILVVINLISEELYVRLDFTEDQRYTLSDATTEVISELEDVITVKAYFTEELPPQLAFVRNDLRDQLIEYEDRSDGNIVFEFINPNESDELKQQALSHGIAPISINVVEDDQRQQLQAFLGVVFQSGDEQEVIPIIQPGASMEYDITTAIKKLSMKEKPKIGWIQGYGEPSINQIPQLAEQLSVLYELEPVSIRDSFSIPGYYKSLLWVGPSDTVDRDDLEKLDKYLGQGGNLFIAYSTVKGDLSTAQLKVAPDIGINSWLKKRGISLRDEFVVDAQCAAVTVQQRSGYFTINSQVEFPFFPQVNNFADHPVTSGLEGMLLPFVNPITVSESDSLLNVIPLAYSSELSGTRKPPIYVDIQKKWGERDFNSPEQILAVAAQKAGPGDDMVVVANSTFVVNGSGQQMQQLNPDNVSFASNAVDWLSDDTGLIELRTKGITSRPLESVEEGIRSLIKYSNVFAPILLIVLYGIIRRSIRIRKRQKWAAGNFS